MNLADLRVLLDYHYWARDRALDAAAALTTEQLTRDLGSSFKSVRDTLAHIYFADWVWYQRWLGDSPAQARSAEEFGDVAALRASWSQLEGQVRALVDRLGEDGIRRAVEYKLLSGQPGKSVFWHLVQHVVNHASYHRGQVTTMLRQLDAQPPKSMDLVAFHRERSG